MKRVTLAVNVGLITCLLVAGCDTAVTPESGATTVVEDRLFYNLIAPHDGLHWIPAEAGLAGLPSDLTPKNQSTYPFNFPGAADETTPFGISDNGEIVGVYFEGGVLKAFHWDRKNYHTLEVPGALQTRAQGINNAGTIVGRYTDGGGVHGFILDASGYTTVDVPGAAMTSIWGINNHGHMVGFFNDGAAFHGFLWDGSGYTTIDLPGFDASFAFEINDNGLVVGEALNFPSFDGPGFVYEHGTLTQINVPGADRTRTRGINNAKIITGFYVDAGGEHGYVLDKGVFTVYDVPSFQTALLAINNPKDLLGITLGVGENGLIITTRKNVVPGN